MRLNGVGKLRRRCALRVDDGGERGREGIRDGFGACGRSLAEVQLVSSADSGGGGLMRVDVKRGSEWGRRFYGREGSKVYTLRKM